MREVKRRLSDLRGRCSSARLILGNRMISALSGLARERCKRRHARCIRRVEAHGVSLDPPEAQIDEGGHDVGPVRMIASGPGGPDVHEVRLLQVISQIAAKEQLSGAKILRYFAGITQRREIRPENAVRSCPRPPRSTCRCRSRPGASDRHPLFPLPIGRRAGPVTIGDPYRFPASPDAAGRSTCAKPSRVLTFTKMAPASESPRRVTATGIAKPLSCLT